MKELSKTIIDKVLSLSVQLRHIPVGRNKHISFLLQGSRVVGIGFNDYYTTHPLCKRYGYLFNAIHSELDVLVHFRRRTEQLQKCKLINVRINTLGEIGMSKPCSRCRELIKDFGIRHTYYTNIDGKFEYLC